VSAVARNLAEFTILARETERLADLVRRAHPSLATCWLEPDGKYQTRGITLDALTREVTDCLAAHFRERAPDEFPMLYCGWGKAGVGSTALLRAGGPAFIDQRPRRSARRLRPIRPWRVRESASASPENNSRWERQ